MPIHTDIKRSNRKVFQALYSRYKDELIRQSERDEAFFPWPATYSNGIIPTPRKDYRLLITQQRSGKPPEILKELNWDTLMALPQQEMSRRIVSAQGWTNRANWKGILVSDLLDWLQPAEGITHLVQANLLGHQARIPVEEVRSNQALLCYQADNQLLTPTYGGPLWFLVFHRYTYTGLTQLSELILTDKAGTNHAEISQNNFWLSRGYSEEGIIQAGSYYAFDSQSIRPVGGDGEITEY